MRSLRSLKCLKTTVQLTFTTQKANVRSPWTTCSVFNWKYLFLGKFSSKTRNYQFKLKFCTQTNSNMHNSKVIFTFFVLDWRYLFHKFGPKNRNCQFVFKFRTRLICRIMQKICGVNFFSFRPEKPFLGKHGQKNQNRQLKQKFGTKKLI